MPLVMSDFDTPSASVGKVGGFSVLMSVYSKSDPVFVNEAMESIWTYQTLKPMQICIVKDGVLSSKLNQVISSWCEKLNDVITVVELSENKGLAQALNEGLVFCKCPLIARMDSDDVSLPRRFELQYEFFNAHSDIDVLGTQVEERDDQLQEVITKRTVPQTHTDIVHFAKLRSPLSHPSVMFKKSSVLLAGGYPNFFPEDYPLWVIMIMSGYKFANLSETLLIMRSGGAYKFRRGIRFFIRELSVLVFFKKIRFLTWCEFFKSIVVRLIYRISPACLKILVKSCFSQKVY